MSASSPQQLPGTEPRFEAALAIFAEWLIEAAKELGLFVADSSPTDKVDIPSSPATYEI
jgi:hypothetical protein